MRTINYASSFNQQSGLSLIELLVAMGLSLLLLAGVLVMFSSSRSTYETNDRIARIQENGRVALDFIAKSSRSAGYAGCASNLPEGVKAVSTLNKPAGMPAATIYGQDFAITGYNYMSPSTWTPALDTTGWASPPEDGSDILLVMQPRSGVQPVELTTSMTSKTDDIKVKPIASGVGPFNVGQILMLAGCNMRSYFQITNYDVVNGIIKHDIIAADTTHPGNTTNDLGYAYSGTDQPTSNIGYASIISLQSVIYYVRSSTAGNGNSLWRRVDGLPPEELIEGVDSMQLRYGVDTTGDRIVDQYVTADAVTNSNNIVSLQIALLVRSVESYGTISADSKTYNVLDATFTAPGDHRLRQLFTTSLTLRNSAK